MILLFILSCKKSDTVKNPQTDEFTDPRDGQTYPFKKIGTQVWLTKSLNYKPQWCIDCATYGGLYDWNTALTIAPPGWHLPSDAEWTILTDYLGGEAVAGGKMKSTTGWASPNTSSTNSSGFAGLPGGSRHFSDGSFNYAGYYGYWWSSTTDGTSFAWIRGLLYTNADARRGGVEKAYGFSVRCVRD